MAESEIIIPLEVVQLIGEQRQIIREAAVSQSKIAELDRFAQQVPANASTQTLAPFTEESTPISELNAVLQQLPLALSEIQQLEERIQRQTRVMQQSQSQPSPRVGRSISALVEPSTPQPTGSVNRMIWVSVGVVIFIIILFVLLHH